MRLPEIIGQPLRLTKSVLQLELQIARLVAKVGVKGSSELTKHAVSWTQFLLETDVMFAKFVTTFGLESAGKLIFAWLLERQIADEDPDDLLHQLIKEQDGLSGLPKTLGSDISFGTTEANAS